MTSGPGPRIGEPVVEDFLLVGGDRAEFDGLVDDLREVDHFVAADLLLFEELVGLVDAEGGDGEAVRDRGAFSLEAFDGGEEREAGGDVVLDEEDALAGDVAAFDAALVAVGLGGLTNEDARLVETVGQSGGVGDAGAFDARNDVEFETEFDDLRGHSFKDVAPGFRDGRQAAVVDVDRGDQAGLEAHRTFRQEGHGAVVDEVFGEDVFSNLGLEHFLYLFPEN